MSENFEKGKNYKDFECLDVFEVADYHSTVVYLRHLKTGLEVFHMVNSDPENLFSFAFKTPNEKSTGAAHILEHSVLCGSENFPLKDPFVNLSNQSVKTYLNAMTYPDRTVFPASSIVKADYFNLMNVYGDAVFFPKLEKEIFLQEAHRLEIDENGTPSIQGVVYNEMKGNYSSFDSVAGDACNISLLRDCIYEKDSGGDPLEIPTFTYEEFLAFHRKWYRPDNCFVFLYGNIPTEEQLDFIQEHFLERLEKKYPDIKVSEKNRSENLNQFLKYVTPAEIKAPFEYSCEGPASEDENTSGDTVVVNWSLGPTENAEKSMLNTVIAGILMNHDGSPLQKALVDSGLGEDMAPQSGLSNYIYHSMLSIGLRGVKKGDAKKIEDLVLKTLRKLADEGIKESDIQATMMSLEFSQREIKRSGGPYSLVLMNRPIFGWLYGFDVRKQFKLRSILEEIRSKIKNEKGFLENKIKEFLIENPRRVLVVVTPSKEFNANRERLEKQLVDSLMQKTTVESVKADCEKLHEFQRKTEDSSCLPHLNPKDFFVDGHPVMNKFPTEINFLKGVDESEIPYIVNRENTNGIIYFDVGFPVDVLNASDYPKLTLFSEAVAESGWKDIPWDKTSELCALHTGGLGVSLISSSSLSTPKAMELRKKYDWCDREWLVFRISMIDEEYENALGILSDCITGTDFHDLKRLQDIANELRNDIFASVIPDGHSFASMRAKSLCNRSECVDEIFNGITQVYTIQSLAEKDQKENAEDFRRILEKVRSSGCFIHVTAEDSGIEKLNSVLPKFISQIGLKHPAKKLAVKEEDFFSLVLLDGQKKEDKLNEILATSGQIGFAAECMNVSNYDSKFCPAEEVCAHWLSNNLLWEKLRTIGGAYGAFCHIDSVSCILNFATYRDPNPMDSCDTFESCLLEASQKDFDKDSVEKAIMGYYSHWIQPTTPRGKGSTALMRTLYAIHDDDRERKLTVALNVTPEDLRSGFKRLYEFCQNPKFKNRTFLTGKSILNKKELSTGNITILPL